MIGKRIGTTVIAFVLSFLVSAEEISDVKDDKAKAGVVVSITEDFLQRGQNELL